MQKPGYWQPTYWAQALSYRTNSLESYCSVVRLMTCRPSCMTRLLHVTGVAGGRRPNLAFLADLSHMNKEI